VNGIQRTKVSTHGELTANSQTFQSRAQNSVNGVGFQFDMGRIRRAA
jgi:hypothetical protein